MDFLKSPRLIGIQIFGFMIYGGNWINIAHARGCFFILVFFSVKRLGKIRLACNHHRRWLRRDNGRMPSLHIFSVRISTVNYIVWSLK